MSGGYWNYRSHEIREQAEGLHALLELLAQAEHLMDWALEGDTSMADAPQRLWDLMKEGFDKIYGT